MQVFIRFFPLENLQQCHILPSAGTSPLPNIAATWLDSDDEALFALGSPSGSVTLIKLSNLNGIVTSNVLKSSSYFFERMWGNFGGILTGRSQVGVGGVAGVGGTSGGSDVVGESAVSLAIHPIQNDIYVFALCRDNKVGRTNENNPKSVKISYQCNLFCHRFACGWRHLTIALWSQT